jgi:hypothetical protein
VGAAHCAIPDATGARCPELVAGAGVGSVPTFGHSLVARSCAPASPPGCPLVARSRATDGRSEFREPWILLDERLEIECNAMRDVKVNHYLQPLAMTDEPLRLALSQ